MYSYEDRIQAVELFIKRGKRVRPTIRQLGYPTKNALKGWYREYEQRLDLPVGYAGREPKYSQAQKEVAVEHYLTHDQCIAATMRALGYPGGGTLTAWVREAPPESRKPVVGSVGRPRYPESMKQAGDAESASAHIVHDKVAAAVGLDCTQKFTWLVANDAHLRTADGRAPVRTHDPARQTTSRAQLQQGAASHPFILGGHHDPRRRTRGKACGDGGQAGLVDISDQRIAGGEEGAFVRSCQVDRLGVGQHAPRVELSALSAIELVLQCRDGESQRDWCRGSPNQFTRVDNCASEFRICQLRLANRAV